MLAQGQAGVCPVDLHRSPERVEPSRLGTGHPPHCIPVQGRTSPLDQGGGKLRGRDRRVPLPQAARLDDRGLEATGVDLLGSGVQPVCRAPRDDAARQQAAQGRDLGLQRVLGRRRRLVAPQLVDEPIPGDEAVGLDEERREEGAGARAAEAQGHSVFDHFERPEYTEVKTHADPFEAPPATARVVVAPHARSKRPGRDLGATSGGQACISV